MGKSPIKTWSWLFWLILPVIGLVSWGILVFADPTSTYNAQQEVRIALAQLEKDPTNFSAAVRAGVGYYNLEDFNKAIDYYQLAASIDPSSSEVLNNLGNAYRELLRFVDAEQAYKQSIILKDDWPTPYLNLAELYERWPTEREDRSTEVATILKTGLEATENDPALLRALIEYYEQAGDTRSAAPYVDLLQTAINNIQSR